MECVKVVLMKGGRDCRIRVMNFAGIFHVFYDNTFINPEFGDIICQQNVVFLK